MDRLARKRTNKTSLAEQIIPQNTTFCDNRAQNQAFSSSTWQYARRMKARDHARKNPMHFNALEDEENLSSEVKFARQFKNPQRKPDEEIVAERDFGFIRLDSLNKPTVGVTDEGWKRSRSILSTDEHKSPTKTKALKPSALSNKIPLQDDKQLDPENRQSHSNEEKNIKVSSVSETEENNVFESQYFDSSKSEESRYSKIDNSHESIYSEQKSKSETTDEINMFENEYFSEVHEKSNDKEIKSNTASNNQETKSNIFEEQYFDQTVNDSTSYQKVSSADLNDIAPKGQPSPFDLIEEYMPEKSSALHVEHETSPEYSSRDITTKLPHARNLHRSPSDIETNSKGDLFEEQYFQYSKPEPNKVPWDEKQTENREVLSGEAHGKTEKQNQDLKGDSKTSFTPFNEFEEISPWGAGDGEEEIKERHKRVFETSVKEYKESRKFAKSSWDKPLPWQPRDQEDKCDLREDPDVDDVTKSPVVARAELNVKTLERGLLAEARDEAGLYDEKKGQFSPLEVIPTSASSEKASEKSIEEMKAEFLNKSMEEKKRNQERPSGLGIHPSVKEKLTTEERSEEVEEKPMTVRELRMQLKREKMSGRKEDEDTAKKPLYDPDSPERFDVDFPGKLDSQGFRLLDSVIMNVQYKTIQDMTSHILNNCVVYQDDDLFVINKPYGLPSIVGPKVHMSMDLLKKPLAEKLNCEELHILHRLDRDTTGIMLLSKNKETANRISEMFKNRQVIKQYLVITKGAPQPEEGILDIPLSVKTIDGDERMFPVPDTNEFRKLLKESGRNITKSELLKNSSPAVTNYRVLSEANKTALVLCQPESGVKHQIRCHLGYALNTPILGDHKYSNFDKMVPQKLHPATLQSLGIRQTKVRNVPMHLHAKQLILTDYTGGKNLYLAANLPKFFRRHMRWLKLALKR